MKKYDAMVPSSEKWKIFMCVTLKILLNEHKDSFLLRHMKKICYLIQVKIKDSTVSDGLTGASVHTTRQSNISYRHTIGQYIYESILPKHPHSSPQGSTYQPCCMESFLDVEYVYVYGPGISADVTIVVSILLIFQESAH